MKETISRYPITEMHEFRFWQFWGSSHHIIQRISAKLHVEDKLINMDFTLSVQRTSKKTEFYTGANSDVY